MLESAYLVLIFIIAFIELVRKKSQKFDFLTLFNIGFFILYPLPGFVLAFDFNNSVSETGLNISNYINNVQTALAIFGGYILVLIGFYSKIAQKLGNNIIIKARDNNLIVLLYAIFLFLFSCLSTYIYSSQFGGILLTLATTTSRRVDEIQGGNLAFFGRLTLFSIFASYLLGSFVFIKKTKKLRLFIIIMFIASVILSCITIAITGGRLYYIYYFSAFYLVYLIKNKTVSWIFITSFICFASVFLVYGKFLFFSLTALPNGYDAVVETFLDAKESQPSGEFNFYNFMANFYYPVYSLDVAFGKNYQLRWFVDFIYGFISLLPDHWFGTEQIKSIFYYNTQYITGSNKFAIPTGFLAFAIYSMWWPGLIVFCFTYGWIGRYLQTILSNHIHSIFWMPFVYVVVAQMWMDFLGSDPETFLQAYFCYLIAVFLLFLIASKISIGRQSKV